MVDQIFGLDVSLCLFMDFLSLETLSRRGVVGGDRVVHRVTVFVVGYKTRKMGVRCFGRGRSTKVCRMNRFVGRGDSSALRLDVSEPFELVVEVPLVSDIGSYRIVVVRLEGDRGELDG
jgi:hypothetical protein